MLKFRCQHCGQRIAVPARHLGKIVTCAECGKPTHPLAREIVGAQPAARPTAAVESPPPVASTKSAVCANCGTAVGRLQASHQWESERVCGPCYHVLSAESSRAAPVVATRVRAPGRGKYEPAAAPLQPIPGLREQIVRGLVVFIVGVVALYGALTLLRDLAGLIAVTAVTVIALLALYGIFRSRWSARFKRSSPPADAALVPYRP